MDGDLWNNKGHGETEMNKIFLSRYLSVVKSSFCGICLLHCLTRFTCFVSQKKGLNSDRVTTSCEANHRCVFCEAETWYGKYLNKSMKIVTSQTRIDSYEYII